MPHRLSKELRAKLHELASLAYERELEPVLESLTKQCAAWDEKHITNSELSAAVHSLHQGPLREIFRFYKGLDSDVLVARAVANNMLKVEEIPAEIFEVVKSKIDVFST